MTVDVSDKEAISSPKNFFSLISRGTHWTGGWAGFRAGLGTDLKAKPSHYTTRRRLGGEEYSC
jgi:hypothetical protein